MLFSRRDLSFSFLGLLGRKKDPPENHWQDCHKTFIQFYRIVLDPETGEKTRWKVLYQDDLEWLRSIQSQGRVVEFFSSPGELPA